MAPQAANSAKDWKNTRSVTVSLAVSKKYAATIFPTVMPTPVQINIPVYLGFTFIPPTHSHRHIQMQVLRQSGLRFL